MSENPNVLLITSDQQVKYAPCRSAIVASDARCIEWCYGKVLLIKKTSHDHDAHVPLIMAGPGIPKGQTRDGMVYLYDLFPTLCDLVDLETPKSVEGQSLLPMLSGDDLSGRDMLYHAYVQNGRAVYDGRYRYLAHAGHAEAGGTVVRRNLLFDMKEDPMEAHDLSVDPDYADHMERLESLLLEQRDFHMNAGDGK